MREGKASRVKERSEWEWKKVGGERWREIEEWIEKLRWQEEVDENEWKEVWNKGGKRGIV